jgi:hypothetical protein
MITRILPVVFLLLSTSFAIADDLGGFWKHAEAPAWIEVSLEEGKATVVRNDKYPERVGRELIKDLEPDDSGQLWRGQVWAERLGEYKEAEITLPEPGQMAIEVKVGFMSRTIEWVRADEVPPAPTE